VFVELNVPSCSFQYVLLGSGEVQNSIATYYRRAARVCGYTKSARGFDVLRAKSCPASMRK